MERLCQSHCLSSVHDTSSIGSWHFPKQHLHWFFKNFNELEKWSQRGLWSLYPLPSVSLKCTHQESRTSSLTCSHQSGRSLRPPRSVPKPYWLSLLPQTKPSSPVMRKACLICLKEILPINIPSQDTHSEESKPPSLHKPGHRKPRAAAFPWL